LQVKLKKDLLANKQLIYVKVKQATFNPNNFAIFKDTPSFQESFLSQLARIPLLQSMDIFNPETLYFSLHKHSHSSARKLKGFLYTASFACPQSGPDIPQLILRAQSAQDKQSFPFELPAVHSGAPTEALTLVKKKVSFHTNVQ